LQFICKKPLLVLATATRSLTVLAAWQVMLPRIIAWVVASSAAIGLVVWLRNMLTPAQVKPLRRPT
jgi:hypothetical protein